MSAVPGRPKQARTAAREGEGTSVGLPPPEVTLRAARRRTGLAPGVPSPCISVCRMNASNGWCEGCFRTLDEIRLWGQAGDAAKLLVWQDIEARQQARDT